jgi:hypothetical protein
VLGGVQLSSNSLDGFTARQRVDDRLTFTDAQPFASVPAIRLTLIVRRLRLTVLWFDHVHLNVYALLKGNARKPSKRLSEHCLLRLLVGNWLAFIKPTAYGAVHDTLYENSNFVLRAFHHDPFTSSQHAGAGKSIRRQIQDGIRGKEYSHVGILFVKMRLPSIVGEKISKIGLVELTPEDVKKAAAPMDSPAGGKVCLKLKPTKALVVTFEKKDASGSPTKSVSLVTEKDGKIVIPMPGPCN